MLKRFISYQHIFISHNYDLSPPQIILFAGILESVRSVYEQYERTVCLVINAGYNESNIVQE